MTYEEYLNLLLSAATNYDIQFAPKKPKRQVFAHHLIDHYDDSYTCDDSYYDIDAPVSMILANSSERRYSKPSGGNGKSNVVRMPRDKWFNLDPKQGNLG